MLLILEQERIAIRGLDLIGLLQTLGITMGTSMLVRQAESVTWCLVKSPGLLANLSYDQLIILF